LATRKQQHRACKTCGGGVSSCGAVMHESAVGCELIPRKACAKMFSHEKPTAPFGNMWRKGNLVRGKKATLPVRVYRQ
jgi:hypothetical protein